MQTRVPTSFSMPLTTLFARRSAHHATEKTIDINDTVGTSNGHPTTTSAGSKHHNRNSSIRITAGLRKMFSGRERDNGNLSRTDSARTGFTRASIANDPINTSGTQSQESQQSRTPSPKPPTTSSAGRVAAIPDSPATTPSSTAGSAFLDSRYKNARAVSQLTVASSKVNTATAQGVLENPVYTPIHTHDDTVSAAPAPVLSQHDVAMAAYAKAEEILAARHASLQAKPEDSRGPKKRLAIIVKKATANETLKVKKTRTKDAAPSAPRPAAASRSIEVQRQPRTTGDAAAIMQRRDRIMGMTYGAVFYGCSDAQDKLERLNFHFSDQEGGRKPYNADIIIGFGDYHLRANELGDFEHIWIARYNTLCTLKEKQSGRVLGIDDYEFLAEQLFPADDARVLAPGYFDIFLEALAEEGVLTKGEFMAIRDLGVTQDEFDDGVNYTSPAVAPRVRARQAANSKTFRMPERAMRTGSTNLAGQTKRNDNLHWYLCLLVEAAVYKQTHYRGFFFGNAASELNHFYQAYKLSKQDKLLPPDLTEYNRPWTYAESRLLERGQLLCNLFKQYEAGIITDFGVLRILRATLVYISGQPRFGKTGMEQLLYDRVAGARIPIRQIPEILALLPDNDTAFACPTMRQEMLAAMNETAAAFEAEEKVRLAEIEADRRAFEKKVKKELGVWGRVKRKAKGVFGRKKKVEAKAFNPFSPEHGSPVPIGKDDGSFYA